jgi:hypothetical protein
MARGFHWLGATLFWLFVAGLAAWLLGLDDLVRRASIRNAWPRTY